MNNNLVYDVGMHRGYDAEAYLKQGYRVIGIEANPELVALCRERLAEYVSNGQLIICHFAIADHNGEITLYVNKEHDDWSTTSETYAGKTTGMGTTNVPITVECRRFQDVLATYGIPYYVKIDIEGADLLCLKALRDFSDRPEYASIEAGFHSREDVKRSMELVVGLGYDRFKLVDQLPYGGLTSGPFGENSPGKWRKGRHVAWILRRILFEKKVFGWGKPLYLSPLHRAYKKFVGESMGCWYDLHCKRSVNPAE